jgi:hypothetical protein
LHHLRKRHICKKGVFIKNEVDPEALMHGRELRLQQPTALSSSSKSATTSKSAECRHSNTTCCNQLLVRTTPNL